jgi:hypothetical protein
MPRPDSRRTCWPPAPPASTPVEGLAPGCAAAHAAAQTCPTLDAAAAEADTVAAALRLVQARTHVDHMVLECTNLPPYAAAVQRATGAPSTT